MEWKKGNHLSTISGGDCRIGRGGGVGGWVGGWGGGGGDGGKQFMDNFECTLATTSTSTGT